MSHSEKIHGRLVGGRVHVTPIHKTLWRSTTGDPSRAFELSKTNTARSPCSFLPVATYEEHYRYFFEEDCENLVIAFSGQGPNGLKLGLVAYCGANFLLDAALIGSSSQRGVKV